MKKGLCLLGTFAILGGVGSASYLLQTSKINEVVATGESVTSVQNVGKLVKNANTGEHIYLSSENEVTAITNQGWEHFLKSVTVDTYTKGTITLNGVDKTEEIKLELIGGSVGFAIGRSYLAKNKQPNDSVITIEGTFADPKGQGTILIEKTILGLVNNRWAVRSLANVIELGKMATDENTAGGIAYISPLDKTKRPDDFPKERIAWWPSMSAGFVTGYVKKNNVNLKDTLSYIMSYDWTTSFDIGRENGSLTETGVANGPVADRTVLTFGGLFRKNGKADSYIYINETTLIFNKALNNWFYPAKEIGYLSTNQHCTVSSLYMNSDLMPEYVPSAADWSGHNAKSGKILVNGEESALTMNFVRSDLGFLVRGNNEGMSYGKGTKITIGGDYYFNFDGINQVVNIKKTTFVLEDNWVDLNVKEANTFADTYLHMKDYNENLGYCADSEHHYYADAKAAFAALSADTKDCFLNREQFKAALERLTTWARMNGEEFVDGEFKALQTAFTPSYIFKENNKKAGAIAITVLSIATLSFSLAFLFKKKKAHK